MDRNLAPAAREQVQDYYDERVAGKLRDFTHPNPRIEAAVQLIAEWAPRPPRRVLEIGCGVGATSWRMARAWPDSEVIGSDISAQSIAVAQSCFKRPNLSYRVGPLAESVAPSEFDLIVMMDVYEHIAPQDRTSLHRAISDFLSPDSRFILTVPTPTLQNWGRVNFPDDQQPVDEDIGAEEIATLAADTGTRQLYYREVGIWRYGDYFHLVLGRYEPLSPVALRQPVPEGVTALKQMVKKRLGRLPSEVEHGRDRLGADVLRPVPAEFVKPFQVSLAERRSIASQWLRGAQAAGA
jgi:SAM-dependent methyltransferase